MSNYKIPKRARREPTTLTGHPPSRNGVPEDARDNMERVSILQEPLLEMKLVVKSGRTATYWTRQSTGKNNRVNPPSHDAPIAGSSTSGSIAGSSTSGSIASETADGFPREEIKQKVLSADEQNDYDAETLPLVQPNRPLSPLASSTTSEFNSSESTDRYSSLDSLDTSDDDSSGLEDDVDEKDGDKDVIVIGLCKEERKEVRRWNRLLFRKRRHE